MALSDTGLTRRLKRNLNRVGKVVGDGIQCVVGDIVSDIVSNKCEGDAYRVMVSHQAAMALIRSEVDTAQECIDQIISHHIELHQIKSGDIT